MGPEVLGCDQLRRPPLDRLAGKGVCHVRGPHALYPFEHSEVDASTPQLDCEYRTGRTLRLEYGMTLKAILYLVLAGVARVKLES